MQIHVQERFVAYPAHAPSDEPLIIHQRTARSHNDRIAIFIHGLGGSPYDTWGNFPGFIYEDFPRIDIGFYSYRSAFSRIKFWKSIEIEGEAEILAHRIRELSGYTHIVLVGHSLGGVLAKAAIAYLVTSNQKKVLRRVTGLLLMASPQLGSARVLRVLRWVPVLSKDMRVLYLHSKALRRINRVFQDYLKLKAVRRRSPSHLPTWAVIASADWWVDELSSSIGLPSDQLCKVSGSHRSLVKPPSKNSDAYLFVRKSIAAAVSLSEDLDQAKEGWEWHQCETARVEDLSSVRRIAVSLFGEEVSSLELIREWTSVNPDSIWTITRFGDTSTSVKESTGTLVGYFCTLPLLPDGEEGVRRGLLTGVNLPTIHLGPSGESPRAVYIGSVAGLDPTARAVTMEQLKSQLQRMAKEKQITIYARPITRDGLRVANQYRLSPLVPGREGLGEIYAGVFPLPKR